MRRFEFSDGTSDKFWEIAVEGETYTVRYGRKGTDGQTSTKVFGSPAEAEKKAASAIAGKVKKGYLEVEASERAVDPTEALIARLQADPAADAWSVLADRLQAEGDPRGELISVQRALAVAPTDALRAREAELLEAHGKDFFGLVRPGSEESEITEVVWANGYWSRVKVAGGWDHEDVDAPKVLSAVLRHPSALFLRELEIGLLEYDGESSFDEAVKLLVKNGIRPALRRLHIGAFEYPDETEISWTFHANVDPLGPILPNLEDLRITGGGIDLGALKADRLRKLVLETGGLPAAPARHLASASFPALEHLEVWFGTDDYGGECGEAEVQALLANTAGLPAVRWLGLKNADFQDAIAAVVGQGALVAQLTHLDLSMGTLTDAGARALLEAMPKLQHLEVLDISENFVSDELVAQLRAAFPGTLEAADQEEQDGDWLYTTVSE